jgi:hypothetical protein
MEELKAIVTNLPWVGAAAVFGCAGVLQSNFTIWATILMIF